MHIRAAKPAEVAMRGSQAAQQRGWMSRLKGRLSASHSDSDPISSPTSHLFAYSIMELALAQFYTHTDSSQSLSEVFLDPRRINYKCGACVFSSVLETMSGAGWVSRLPLLELLISVSLLLLVLSLKSFWRRYDGGACVYYVRDWDTQLFDTIAEHFFQTKK